MDKKIKIDYLFLDNSVCQRCVETQEVLDRALLNVKETLEMAGYKFLLHRVHIDSAEKAVEWNFVSSPTIRVNNRDIAPSLKENNCGDCGELCGCGEETQCRVWEFDGEEYEVPPQALLVDLILDAIYNKNSDAREAYKLPENLSLYFTGKNASQESAEEKSCCDPACCS